MIFNEMLAQDIVNEWFLLRMTQEHPPTAKELYMALGQAVIEEPSRA